MVKAVWVKRNDHITSHHLLRLLAVLLSQRHILHTTNFSEKTGKGFFRSYDGLSKRKMLPVALVDPCFRAYLQLIQCLWKLTGDLHEILNAFLSAERASHHCSIHFRDKVIDSIRFNIPVGWLSFP